MKDYQKLLFDRMKKLDKPRVVILFPRKQGKSDEIYFKMLEEALQSKDETDD